MDCPWISIGLVLLAVALYVYGYLRKTYAYWNVRGVPTLDSALQFSNLIDIITGRTLTSLQYLHTYRKLAPHEYGGLYMLHKPALMIRDPELIKKVMTKDFHYFHDRGMKLHPAVDPLPKQLSTLDGEEWKNVRIKMTTAFSSGKMKSMIPLIEECALELSRTLLCEIGRNDIVADDVDIKDFVCRYLIDSIGSCAFGLNMGSLKNPNCEFRQKTMQLFKFRFQTIVRFVLPNLHPKLIKWFGLTFIDKRVGDYFTSIVKEMLEYREKNKVVRNDFLNLMINLKNNFDSERARQEHEEIAGLERLVLSKNGTTSSSSSNVDITLDVIISQCFVFLGGGFEVTATVMSFFLFEIARHPEIQEKLKKEIDSVLEKHDDDHHHQLTYYALNDTKYLDMVLAETLRVYPPAPVVIRVCTDDYKLDDCLVIDKGTQVFIPIMGLHYDEQYYSNPKQFNPANFEDDAKHRRPQYTYLPFGDGPRACIAERFAKIQMKVALVHLIKNYEFQLSPKMKLPIRFANSTGILTVKDPIRLKCRSRM